MKNIIILFLIFFCQNTHAVTGRRILYPPIGISQRAIEFSKYNSVIVPWSTYVTGISGNIDANATTINVNSNFIDYPRTIRIVNTGGTATDLDDCTITVNGTNYFNRVINDTVTFTNNQTSISETLEAFKTVTSLTFPANCESGTFDAKFGLGVGYGLGLPICADYPSVISIYAINDGSTTAGGVGPSNARVYFNSTQVEGNNIIVPDFGPLQPIGSRTFNIYYYRDRACRQ